MAFTYTGNLASDRDCVRFDLQDTTSGVGPKPDGANFSDAEIDGLITREGNWRSAVAAGFDALATAWTLRTTFSADGTSVNRSDIAAGYRQQAAEYRKKYATIGSAAGSAATTRRDAYSDDVDAWEVDGPVWFRRRLDN